MNRRQGSTWIPVIGHFVPLRQISQDCAAFRQHKAIFLLWVNHMSYMFWAEALFCTLTVE